MMNLDDAMEDLIKECTAVESDRLKLEQTRDQLLLFGNDHECKLAALKNEHAKLARDLMMVEKSTEDVKNELEKVSVKLDAVTEQKNEFESMAECMEVKEKMQQKEYTATIQSLGDKTDSFNKDLIKNKDKLANANDEGTIEFFMTLLRKDEKFIETENK